MMGTPFLFWFPNTGHRLLPDYLYVVLPAYDAGDDTSIDDAGLDQVAADFNFERLWR